MKVKDLIGILSEYDPELEVTDGVSSLYCVEALPAYWDGCYSKLKQDESLSPYYNITGAKIESDGNKLKLVFIGWKEIVWDGCTDIEYTPYSEKYRVDVEKEIAEYTVFNESLKK